ncbi:MAG: IclR family transcriptional regulator [Burkholderiales bacterium]
MYPPARRTLDLLELLADAPDGLALSAIAAHLALAKSVVHRLLAGLAERGFVRQDPATQHYALTLKLAALGFRHLSATRIEDVCQPVLDRLAADSGELARLAVVDGPRMTWVAKAQGALAGLRYDADTGRDVILHATAVGKTWLASLPEEAALRLVARSGFAAMAGLGPRAARTLGAVRQQLRETRRRGYGEAIEEGEPGVAAVAAAIRASAAPDAPVVATVSIAGPLARMNAARRAALRPPLLAAAAELTSLWPVRARRVRATAIGAASATETADVE